MASPPNILFLFPDQHRGDWLPFLDDQAFTRLGMDRIPVRMPNVESLMKRGVTFTKAITPSPVCAPARSCLASGLRYHQCGTRSNAQNYPLDQPSVYQALRDRAGYVVGGVGKFDIHKGDGWWGIDGWDPFLDTVGFSKGFAIDNEGKRAAIRSVRRPKGPDGKRGQAMRDPAQWKPLGPYMAYLQQRGTIETHVKDFQSRMPFVNIQKDAFTTPLSDEDYCDNWVGRNGIDVLRRFPRDKPWFLQVNFVGPHEPFDVTPAMKARWKDASFPPPHRGSKLFARAQQEIRRNYAAMVENIDRNIGLLIDEVEKRGELDNTIIVYSSDHGEMLGDWKRYGKSVPRRGAVHVPLIIAGPGIQNGVSSSALVETQDLVATFIEQAGLDPMPTASESVSLVPVLRGDTREHRSFQVSALGKWSLVAGERYKLVKAPSGTALLDIAADPWEDHDISGANPDVVRDMTALLETERSRPARS